MKTKDKKIKVKKVETKTKKNESKWEDVKTENWIIYDFEMIEHEETYDYVKERGTGTMKWAGKLDTDNIGIFDFEYVDTWTVDNGGDSAIIKSPKPKGMKKEIWENLKDLMEAYLREDYSKNKIDWVGEREAY